VGIAPLPAFEGGKRASCLGGWHIGISRFSDRKESAFRLLRFITSYEVQKGFALNLGWLPARRDVLKDRELLEKLPHLKDISEACSYAVPRPGVPYYVQLSQVLRAYGSCNRSEKSRKGDRTSEAHLQMRSLRGFLLFSLPALLLLSALVLIPVLGTASSPIPTSTGPSSSP